MLKTKIILKIIFSVLGSILLIAGLITGLIITGKYFPFIVNVVGISSIVFFVIGLSWFFYEKYNEEVKKQNHGSKV